MVPCTAKIPHNYIGRCLGLDLTRRMRSCPVANGDTGVCQELGVRKIGLVLCCLDAGTCVPAFGMGSTCSSPLPSSQFRVCPRLKLRCAKDLEANANLRCRMLSGPRHGDWLRLKRWQCQPTPDVHHFGHSQSPVGDTRSKQSSSRPSCRADEDCQAPSQSTEGGNLVDIQS